MIGRFSNESGAFWWAMMFTWMSLKITACANLAYTLLAELLELILNTRGSLGCLH